MNPFTIPKILQCQHYVSKCYIENKRYIKDYEFDLYMGEERDIMLDGRYYKLTRGCLTFRKPGQYIVGYGNYNVFYINLDFSHNVQIAPQDYIRHRPFPCQELCHHETLNAIPDVFIPFHQDELLMLYKKIIKCSYPNVIDPELQKEYISEFLFLVLSDAHRYHREQTEKKAPKANHIERACHFITKNYAGHISIDDLADFLPLNKNYLIKLFKKELNTTPNQYIVDTRLFYARLMLIQTEESVKNIAYACGFSTPSYFIKCFKEKYGDSPVNYKNNYMNGQH